ncbi:olfactory receptor 1019-like [Rhinatrema bivittatum]|uniref:olfactory receptor 1019-like n=1 Tax=Rhinatrema bivittatum TaxID=194408 RepID=UPI00112CE1B9|nr:olfactory receptor 1019-like [Rhinatrema bivittatum]
MWNRTLVTEFIIRGFSGTQELQILYFVAFLVVYLITVVGNLVIIILTKTDSCLSTPMYFFLGNLSSLDVFYVSTTVPKMLANFLANKKVISFYGCAAQLYFFIFLAMTESAVLASMAYDRYVAICNPLHYAILMNRRVCIQMIVASWLVGNIYAVIDTVSTFSLPFCGSNIINHFFCDIPALLNIACANTYVNEVLDLFVGGFLMLGCCFLIVISYMCIISSVLKIPSGQGRGKAFSTCFSHLIVVMLFYGTGGFMYMQPTSSYSENKDSAIAIFYTVITPMLNPIIYSLRNKEIKEALRKMISKKIFSHKL